MTSTRRSVWIPEIRPSIEPLHPPVQADAVVVGAGIVGATAALLLRRQGLDVVLLEALRVGEQVTGGSNAKVTSQHSLIYGDLAQTFDLDLARRYGEANEWAIGDIETRARDLGIECSFERRAAYVYTLDRTRLDDIRNEATVAAQLGLPARFTTDVPLPYETAGGVVFDDQAQFDPYAYVLGLVEAFRREGGRVVEGVRATGLEERGERQVLATTHGEVRARDVVIATNIPFIDDGQYFARALSRAHMVIAARVPREPVDGVFISIDDPTRSLRAVRRGDDHWLLVVGPIFTPGDRDAVEETALIEEFARAYFPVQSIDHAWWNEDYYSVDRLPYVGRLEADREHVYVATGFSGWGITNGDVAAHILADAVRGETHRWADVFDSTRQSESADESPLAEVLRVVTENLDTAKNFVAGLLPASEDAPELVERGQGRVLEIDGEKVAVARDDEGTLHMVSATCTHLGCELAWNGAMQTWDCGCHGSCFALNGAVLRGPAVFPLESKSK